MTLCLNDDVGGSESIGQKPKFMWFLKMEEKLNPGKRFNFS